MATEMGEYLVGAYLKLVEGCDFVDYRVREPGGGLTGLNELDVVGVHFKNRTAYLCEVTTHIRGLLYGQGNQETISRITRKHQNQMNYAKSHLSEFEPVYMFWSPYVPRGYLTDNLANINDLELVGNGYRSLPPDKREAQFTESCTRGAESQQYCLLPTMTLFELVRAVLENPADMKTQQLRFQTDLLNAVGYYVLPDKESLGGS